MLSRQRSTPVHAPCIKVVGGATKLEAALGAKSAGIFDPVSMAPAMLCRRRCTLTLPPMWVGALCACVGVWVCVASQRKRCPDSYRGPSRLLQRIRRF